MANYYLDSEGKLTTKNDKKKKKSTNYYLDSKGRLVPVDDAPEEDSGIKLFKAGAFDDGYQFGDVAKSVGSTVVDAGAGLLKGALSMGEGLIDGGLQFGVAGVADLVGADSFADDVRRVADKNTVDSWFAPLNESAIESNSFLGRSGDATSEALGQIGAILLTGGLGAAAGLSTAGVTSLTTGTMFASSAGAGVSEARNSGATNKEAYIYGLSKGAIDAGSELIFGGLGKTVNALGLSRGISSLDDVFAKKLSSKLSNRAAQNLAEFGVKASAEGLEEVIAGLGSAAAKKLTYMSDTELKQLIEDENLLEQFVGGTIAIPSSFVRLVSVLSVLSLTVTDISFTGLSSLSVTVTEILFARSSTLPSGSTTLILPSTNSRYALAIGAFSSAITTLYPDTTALPLASVISL